MNKERRQRLAKARELLDQAQALVQAAGEIVVEVKDDEQEAFDNLPESLQGADRGQTMQEAIDGLNSVHDDIECLDFDAIMSPLEDLTA